MTDLDPEVEREIEAERARYVTGATDDVEITVAPNPGMIFEVRFDYDQLKTLFAALREGERTIEFIRQAALETAQRRTAETTTEAAS
jgi:hypothetical protein